MDVNPYTAAGVFILMSAGAACLFRALARLWEIGRLRNIPIAKIGAAPVGWTALLGLAQARQEIEDPLFKSPCLLWRCVVQGFVTDSMRDWSDVKEVSSSELFYLDNGTGRVIVAPQGTEFHVGDLEERIVDLTAENHGELAPLLKA